MRIYIFYILGTLAGLFNIQPISSMNDDTNHLAKLQHLIDNNLSYTRDVTADSIISWEKELDSQLEKEKKYDLLFFVKQLVASSYATRGDITIAVERAHAMYEQAKRINYEPGIALSLRAIGNAYLEANMQQQAIDSYKEAIRILQGSTNSTILPKMQIMPNLILTLLKMGKLDEASIYLRMFENLVDEHPGSTNLFYASICHCYYNIITDNPKKAHKFLNEADSLYQKHNFIYLSYILSFLHASYYELTQQYDLALQQYNLLTESIRPDYAPNRYTQLKLQQAQILSLLGKTDEACFVYQKANALQDSLDNISYTRQINELRTLYQIDKLELANQVERNKTITYGILAVLILLGLITSLILYLRKKNKHLLHSKIELEKAQKNAENSIRTKSLFLSNMSHEIRTPLNALSGFSAILSDDSINNETRQQCNDIIQQNSELLLKLINDVIDLSSLEIGKLTFNFRECDAVIICRNVIDTVEKVKQTQAGVRFLTTLETLPLLTDDSRLQQVLINLLINATKFTTEGMITLEIKKTSEDMVLFSVTDTGCGIPLEKQGQIFNRFEKLNEGAQGTGLGLSICQLIIEQIGGTIWIDPEYTDGARFIFTHPVNPSVIDSKKKAL